MTVTDDQIRTALDHRLRTAGLDHDDALPPPRSGELRLAVEPPRPTGRRALAVAAAVIVLAGIGVLLARAPGDDGSTRTGTAGTPTTAEPAPSTTAAAIDGRGVELPPPWPQLDVRPAPKLDLGGDPIDSEQEFAERLPGLDAQTKEQLASEGRMNVIDELTGEVVEVDAHDYDAQWFEVIHWYRDHLGLSEEAMLGELDPAIVFTDGSFRIVHRADLDCSPLPDGRTRPACVRLDPVDLGDATGPTPPGS